MPYLLIYSLLVIWFFSYMFWF